MQFTAIPDTHPLLLPNLRAKMQTSPEEYLRATVGIVDGFGTRLPKPRPFRQDQAVKQFCSWVYKAAMLNAKAFASVPLRLYVRKNSKGTKYYRTREVSHRRKSYLMGEGRERPSGSVLAKVADIGSDFEEVTEPHPALQVLASANDWQNGYELSVLRALYWQITGNAYIHPVMSSVLGVPSELWVMPSQWMRIIPDKTDFISGYIYGRKPNEIQFTPDEVIQWKLPNLEDPFYGRGWVESLWSALGLHNAKRTMDIAKFENNARPDWMLVVKSGANSTALDRLEAAVEGKLKGAHNSGRFLSVTGDVEAIPLNFDVVEVGDPDKVIEEIAAVSDVPLYKLRGNDPVKANSEIQDSAWLRDTILPYCRMDEEQLNARYLPLFDMDDDAVLAYDNPVSENRQLEADIAVKKTGGAYITINEQREDDGLPPVEGGDALRGEQPNPLAGKFNVTPADGLAVPSAQEIQTTTDTVLNGAQITAAVDIISQVTAGTLLRDSGLGMLQVMFNLTPEKAEQMMGGAGTKEPTTANPNPTKEAEQQAQLEALKNPKPENNGTSNSTGAAGESGATPPVDSAGKSATEVERASERDSLPNTKEQAQAARARPLPQGTQLIPILRKMFAHQRSAVLLKLQGKSLGDLEYANSWNMYGIEPKGVIPRDWEDDQLDCLIFHAKRRARVMQAKASNDPSKLPPAFVPLDEWTPTLAAEVKPVIEVLMMQDARRVLAQVGASPDVFHVVEKNIPAAAQKLSLKFAESTNATTSMQLDDALSKLRDEISAGLTEGDTRVELTNRVNEVFDMAEKSRAETIARTEGSRAAHTGELMGAKESGVVSGKYWIASADACDECLDLAAMGTIPLDQDFTETDYGPVSTPPLHPRCMCSEGMSTEDPEEKH